MKLPFFIVVCLFSIFTIDAQTPNGRIFGIIIDKSTQEPLEFATVVIKNTSTQATTGGLTDDKGKINIENVKFGSYSLEISYLGYDSYKSQIKIGAGNNIINLGKIALSESAQSLQTVDVMGEKKMFQLGGEKKIFNVEKSAISAGGNAIDAMKQIPMVDVTMDGTISVRGSENVEIYINGRPTGMSQESQQAILESLPADAVESIELITNPSAKYDASGTAGIINIVLKKNYNRGLNGMVNVGYGTKYKNNAGLTLNFKKNKINFTSSFNYRFQESFNEGLNHRKNIFNTINYFNSESNSTYHTFNGNMNLGLDIDLTNKATLTLGNILSAGGGPNREINETSFLDENQNYYAGFLRVRNGHRRNFNDNTTIAYRQKLKNKGQQLDMSGMFEKGYFERPKDFMQTDFDSLHNFTSLLPLREFNNNTSKNTSTIFQTDYTHPFKKHGELDAGFKISYRNINSDFYADSTDRITQETIPDESQINNFNYKETINAAYASYGGKIKNFEYKAGLRMEQTNISILNDKIGTTFKNSYVQFFPSVFLSQKFPKDHEAQLSYTRRINRPNPWMLNPFSDFDDPLNIRVGNPYLEPEIIDAVELTYLKNWKSTFLTASVYYRYTDKNFSRVRTVDPITSVATMTWANIDNSQSVGGEVILRTPITQWWNIMLNTNIFHKSVQGQIPGEDNDNSVNNFQWNIVAMSSFKFWKGTELQLQYRYMSKMVYLQGYINPFQNLDIGIKKDFLKDNKASIALNVTDLFNTRVFKGTNSGATFDSDMKFKWESRIFTINFSYKFGRNNNTSKKRPTNNMIDGGDDMMGF